MHCHFSRSALSILVSSSLHSPLTSTTISCSFAVRLISVVPLSLLPKPTPSVKTGPFHLPNKSVGSFRNRGIMSQSSQRDAQGDGAQAPLSCDRQSKSKCIPCESLDTSALVEHEEVERQLASSLPLWKVVSRTDATTTTTTTTRGNESTTDEGNLVVGKKTVDAISCKFTAKNFQAALNAIQAMGAIAEREGHHPDLHLTSYREVEVVLYTHKLGGVTVNDLELAQIFDAEVDVEYSPKWLRQHPEAQKEKKQT